MEEGGQGRGEGKKGEGVAPPRRCGCVGRLGDPSGRGGSLSWPSTPSLPPFPPLSSPPTPSPYLSPGPSMSLNLLLGLCSLRSGGKSAHFDISHFMHHHIVSPPPPPPPPPPAFPWEWSGELHPNQTVQEKVLSTIIFREISMQCRSTEMNSPDCLSGAALAQSESSSALDGPRA